MIKVFVVFILCTASSICSSTIIELNFLDERGEGGWQSLEFNANLSGYGPFGEYEFGDVAIFDEGSLYELRPLTSRLYQSIYSGSFYFQVQTFFTDPDNSLDRRSTSAVIRSQNIVGFDDISATDFTPSILEEILDSSVGKSNLFFYDFYVSFPGQSELYTSNYSTTLQSWNYKMHTVPETNSVWLLATALMAFLGRRIIDKKRIKLEDFQLLSQKT